MNYNTLLQKVEDHVNLFFAEHPDARLLYHNISHTRAVADVAKKIAAYYQLDERSRFIVCTAAWFHNTGYLVKTGETPELKSTELAETFLKSMAVNGLDITDIKKCIVATEMPQQPVSLPEKIICDASLFYYGTPGFKEKTKLLKKEKELLNNIKISAAEWRVENIKTLEAHAYHTDYCRLLLDEKYIKATIKYFDEFYATLNNPAALQKEFGYPCYTGGTGNVIIKGLKED